LINKTRDPKVCRQLQPIIRAIHFETIVEP
jgi:hypothetical protein